MVATLIDGKAVARALRERIAEAVQSLATAGIEPGLAVVLVGEDPASHVYVRNKVRACGEVGIRSDEHRLPAETGEAEVLALIERLNADPSVHGILLQLPVPAHLDAERLVGAIDPAKDVDGLTPESAGRLVLGRPLLVPCTPQGSIMLVKSALGGDLSGREAVVIGRSILVGKPVALLLQGENCTVTMAHSRTKDLAEHCRRADILVAAVGRPGLVKGDWVRPGAVVIDVGTNRMEKPDGGSRLVGDVDFDAAAERAGFITPVPGGVGPMTIACLLRNTVVAATNSARLPLPEPIAA